MSKTWGFFFGGSGHGPESSCQISAYYKFFPGKSYSYRTKYYDIVVYYDYRTKSAYLSTLLISPGDSRSSDFTEKSPDITLKNF